MVLELRGCAVDLERRVVHLGGAHAPLSEYEHGVLRYLSIQPSLTRAVALFDQDGQPAQSD
ncbi:MAG: hypothetical protein ACI8S6_001279 [Myxococcota bacterium]|jgi:hypothetical protein